MIQEPEVPLQTGTFLKALISICFMETGQDDNGTDANGIDVNMSASAPGLGPSIFKRPSVELEDARAWFERAGRLWGAGDLPHHKQPKPSPTKLAETVYHRPAGDPLLKIEDVHTWVTKAADIIGYIHRFGQPQSSWRNKMPYRHPPPKYLARGLVRPTGLKFETEHQRRDHYRQARKRKKFLFGTLPTWSFMVANLALLSWLVVNPRFPWSLP